MVAELVTVEVRHPLFNHGDFPLRSGGRSSFKIDCDALTGEDFATIAAQVAGRLRWKNTVNCGGASRQFANALDVYNLPLVELPTLVVDDVWTTGATMRKELNVFGSRIGVVLFARTPITDERVTAVFTMWEG